MAAGRIDIILAAKPEALIDGMNKGQAAIKQYEQIVGNTVRNNQQVFAALGDASIRLSGVAKSAFETMAGGITATSSIAEKETAKMVGNVAAIAEGVATGATSFLDFQDVATSSLKTVADLAPSVSASIASLAGPIGLAIGAIGALVTGYLAYSQAVGENNDALERNNEQIKQAEVEAGVLFKKLKDGNLTYAEKSKVIGEINDKYGSHLKYIADEKKFVQELDRVYKQVIESIKLKFAIQANEKEIERIIGQIQANEKLIGIQQKSLEYYNKLANAAPGTSNAFNSEKEIDRLKGNNKALEKEANDLLAQSAEFGKRLGTVFTDPAPKPGKKKDKDIFFLPNDEQIIGAAVAQARLVIDTFNNELGANEAKFKLIPDSGIEQSKEEVKILEKAIQQLGVIGFEKTNVYVTEFSKRLEEARLRASGISNEITATFQSLQNNSAQYTLIPESEVEKTQNEVRILTDILQKLGQEGFAANNPIVEEFSTKLADAKTKLEELKDAAKVPEGGFKVVGLDNDNKSGPNDKPESVFDKLQKDAESAGNRVLKSVIGFDAPDTAESQKKIADLQRELTDKQEVLRSGADKKAKDAARERIALIREEIDAEKERGNVFTSVANNVFNAIRQEIKGLLAKAVAYSIINALKLGPVGALFAAPAAAGAAALFDKLVPKLDVGTNQVLSSGLAIIHAGEEVRPATVVSGSYNDKRSQGPIPIYGELSAYSIKIASDIGAEKMKFIA